MTKKHEIQSSQSNFWSGLALGVVFGASSLYVLGTKKGRKFLHQVMEAVENIEDMGEDVIEEVSEFISEYKGAEADSPEGKKQVNTGTVESIIDKIQSAIPEKKQIKKYFFKEGKILKE